MKRYHIYRLLIVALTLGMVSCDDTWDEHYKDTQSSNLELSNGMEELSKMDKYSDFYNALVQYGIAEKVDDEFIYTMFIPPNGKFSLEGIPEEERARTLYSHIVNGEYYKHTLEGRKQTNSGKWLRVEENPDSMWIHDQTTLNDEGLNVDLEGIVIHEIDTVIRYLQNTYEYLTENSFYFKQYLDANIIYTADIENSEWTGEFDGNGQKVYDTLWVASNAFLEDVLDITDEDQEFTVVMPDAASIDGEFERKALSYYDVVENIPLNIYRPVFQDMLDESIFVGKYYSNDIPELLISALGKEMTIETDSFEIKDVPLSNGILNTTRGDFYLDENLFVYDTWLNLSKHVVFPEEGGWEHGKTFQYNFVTQSGEEFPVTRKNKNRFHWEWDPNNGGAVGDYFEVIIDENSVANTEIPQGLLNSRYELFYRSNSSQGGLEMKIQVIGDFVQQDTTGLDGVEPITGTVEFGPYNTNEIKNQTRIGYFFNNKCNAPVTLRFVISGYPEIPRNNSYDFRIGQVVLKTQRKVWPEEE